MPNDLNDTLSTHYLHIIYTARCRCDVCTRWMMEAVESRGKEAVSRLEVGFWTPAGPHLKDDLFPHVKGNFRGRVIPVASVHVSYGCEALLHTVFIASYSVSAVAKPDKR